MLCVGNLSGSMLWLLAQKIVCYVYRKPFGTGLLARKIVCYVYRKPFGTCV